MLMVFFVFFFYCCFFSLWLLILVRHLLSLFHLYAIPGFISYIILRICFPKQVSFFFLSPECSPVFSFLLSYVFSSSYSLAYAYNNVFVNLITMYDGFIKIIIAFIMYCRRMGFSLKALALTK